MPGRADTTVTGHVGAGSYQVTAARTGHLLGRRVVPPSSRRVLGRTPPISRSPDPPMISSGVGQTRSDHPLQSSLLRGQTLVVIGGSAGIGLETAATCAKGGSRVILTARGADRLKPLASSWSEHRRVRHHRLRPPRQVLRRATRPGRPRPRHRPWAVLRAGRRLDFDAARRDLEIHLLLLVQVARNAAAGSAPAGHCSSSAAPAAGDQPSGPLTAALRPRSPRSTKNLALELAPIRVNLIAAGIRRHAAVGRDPRRGAGGAARAASRDPSDPARRRPRRHRRTGGPPHDQHGCHRRDLRHRRRPTAAQRLMKLSSRAPCWSSHVTRAATSDSHGGNDSPSRQDSAHDVLTPA